MGYSSSVTAWYFASRINNAAQAVGLSYSSAMGVLIGSRARTIEALSGLVNLTIMPMWMVSGVFFSAQRFPDWLQPLIQALPLTAFVNAMRAIQLQGAGLADVRTQLVVLAVWLVGAFIASRRLFKWQ